MAVLATIIVMVLIAAPACMYCYLEGISEGKKRERRKIARKKAKLMKSLMDIQAEEARATGEILQEMNRADQKRKSDSHGPYIPPAKRTKVG